MASLFSAQEASAATEEIHEMRPFEVIGTRLVRDYMDNLGPAGIVPATGHSEQVRPSDTWTAMSFMPGLHVEQPSSLAGNTVLYLRGGEPNFTKVLFDGIELNNLNSSRGGTYNFNGISLIGVERIEVLAGAHSSVYGSDAISGVINISSLDWTGQRRPMTFEIEGGEYGYFRSGFAARHATKSARYVLSASRLEETGLPTGEIFKAWQANGGIMARLGGTTDLSFSFVGSDMERRHYPDDSGGFLYAGQDLLDFNTSEELGVQLSLLHRLSDSGELVARWFWYHLDAVDDSPGVLPGIRDPFGVPPNRFESVLDRWKAQAYLRSRISDQVFFVLGLEHLSENGSSQSWVTFPWAVETDSYDLRTDTESLFAEGGVEISSGQRVELALRMDDISGVGQVQTGRVSYEAESSNFPARIRVSFGEGFKKPSFFAIGNPVVGNPELRPERSDLIEAGITTDLVREKLQVRATVFRQEFTDLIDLSEAPPPQLINLNEVVSKGALISLSYAGQGWLRELLLHTTWQDVEVQHSEELLRNRPRFKIGLSATIKLSEELLLDILNSRVGSRKDSSVPTGTVELDAYLRSDIGLRWNFHKQFWAQLVLENLWDEAYQPVVGMPVPGRRLRVGLRWLY